MNLKARLIEIIRKRSYKTGSFVLASGKKSDHYIDMRVTSLYPEGAWLIGQLCVERVMELGWEIDGVGGMTLGADPLVTSVSLAARERGLIWPALIVRKEAKDHGTGQRVEGSANFPKGAPRRILVLEDTTSTGGSSMKAVQALREEGFQVVGVLTIVDREMGGRELFLKENLPFSSIVRSPELRKA